MRVFFLRHGETDWNVKGLYQGQKNIPLNENGRRSADEIGEKLADIRFDLLVTSDLDRAKETGVRILLRSEAGRPACDPDLWPFGKTDEMNGIRFFTDARVREIGFGSWEGLCFKKEGYNLPAHDFTSFWDDRYDDSPPEGAERKKAFLARVDSFLDELSERFGKTDETILVVSHGGVARAVKYRFSGAESLAAAATKNCEVIMLAFAPETGWSIEGRKDEAQEDIS